MPWIITNDIFFIRSDKRGCASPVSDRRKANALSRVSIGVEQFDFSEEKIFGEPDAKGLSMVTKVTVKRAAFDSNGNPRNYIRHWALSNSECKG